MSYSELISSYLEGDEGSFHILCKKIQPMLYNYINSIVKDSETAKDYCQDVLIKVFLKIKSGKYLDNGRFMSWLLTIARNMVGDDFRKQNKYHFYSFDENDNISFNNLSCENSFDDLSDNVNYKLLYTTLSPNQRHIIYLRYFRELSYKDIAKAMSININTALGINRYAVVKMRKQYYKLYG